LGRVVLYDGYDIAGGGHINMDGYPDQRQALTPKSDNITKVDHLLSHDIRAQSMGQRGGVFWFTGLSGAGKSTIAMAAEKALFDKGFKTYVLDGDNIRHGLNADLGFSPEDRAENIRRIGHVASLMADAGLIVITAFISPYQADRARARTAAPDQFHEIFVKADLETCESRDPKGLYKKARSGEISEFTGIDSPYEEPGNPEMVVDTQANDIATCVDQVVKYVEAQVALLQTAQKEKALS
jgi:bifunctional enzyme CysN/CysC